MGGGMHFVTGELVEIFHENALRMGRVRVGGALDTVALELVPDARVGDLVLLHAGVALSRVEPRAGSGERSAPEG
jgi:hydrogenase expression/formation protein HypC